MKAGIPSEHSQYSNKAQVEKRKPSDGLRPWGEVASLYTEKTGEPMNAKLAENINQRALKKLRIALEKASNAQILETFSSEFD
jgi:hypothetical protein